MTEETGTSTETGSTAACSTDSSTFGQHRKTILLPFAPWLRQPANNRTGSGSPRSKFKQPNFIYIIWLGTCF